MRFAFIIFSSLFLTFSGKCVTLDSIRSEQRDDGLYVIHQVEEEETLYSIAKRYGSSVQRIVEDNNILDLTIDIGQVLAVLVVEKKLTKKDTSEGSGEGIHIVKQGETLYSISKTYGIKIKDLKKWNNLQGNDISMGMSLKVKSSNTAVPEPEETLVIDSVKVDVSAEVDTSSTEPKVVEPIDPYAGFEKYLVQTGETLGSIARKIGVQIDSLKVWNELNSDYLKIGQSLFFKEQDDTQDISLVEKNSSKQSVIDEDGFEQIYEEGTAAMIETMNTSKFLALHRTLPIGTNVKVRNLMNNQVVHVKVVGKLPKTGLNKNLLIRLSQSAYEQLGALDSKVRVEVSHYKSK